MKSKLLLLTILFLFLSLISIAYASNYGSVVITEILSVYDGDTFRCNIPNYPPLVGHNMPIRIRGIYCLEINDKDIKVKYMGIKAKEFTQNKLLNAKVIKLKNINRGKYFWIIADVEVDGEDLGKMLIKEGLAIPYYGGKKVDRKVEKIPTKKVKAVAPTRISPSLFYVASKNSNVYHRADCSYAVKIKGNNLVVYKNKDEAVGTGRRGCGRCEP